jgi:hypothetical protein
LPGKELGGGLFSKKIGPAAGTVSRDVAGNVEKRPHVLETAARPVCAVNRRGLALRWQQIREIVSTHIKTRNSDSGYLIQDWGSSQSVATLRGQRPDGTRDNGLADCFFIKGGASWVAGYAIRGVFLRGVARR